MEGGKEGTEGEGGGICWLGSGLHLRSPSPLRQAPSPSH